MTWLPTGLAGLALGLVAVAIIVRFALTVAPSRSPRTSPVAALKRLRGWHVVDRVAVDDAQVDHVVIAPAAVLAIVNAHDADDQYPARDLDAAERAAARVREFLRMRRAGDTVVVPVVWVSGPDAGVDGGHRLVEGVHLVDGDNPAAWLHVFREARLAGADRLRVCRELDAAVPTGRTVATRSIRPVQPPAADAA